ncbi:HD domain-containing protein [Candidatus Saccharibacteria bacterium]|nr:HD domain-containing protein [Candidatus Saccharibacteria bacterium]
MKNQVITDDHKRAQRAHDDLLTLGRLSVELAKVQRRPRYPDGHRENDSEHSFHLSLSAIELAADYYPELDIGLVAQFSLVHDLPEIYAGDVWTFSISDEDRAKKEEAERRATQKLMTELPTHTAQLLKRYEKQIEPEAKFVRFVDKLLPAIINIMAGDACTFKEDNGVITTDDAHAGHKIRTARYQAMFPEFPFIHMVRELVSKTSVDHVFNRNK